MSAPLPVLHVEGPGDVSVVSALLYRHGIDTKRGTQCLDIRSQGSVDAVLEIIPDAIRSGTDKSIGFVIDIDVHVADRWAAAKNKLHEAGVEAPEICPPIGFIGQMPGYPFRCGVWLMPDCRTDCGKLEHLVESLVPSSDPLWPHAQGSVENAKAIVDNINKTIPEDDKRWKRFRDVDRIKAEVHTWLAWQECPGSPLGTAVKERILGHDSPQAIQFLRWLDALYGFEHLTKLVSLIP